MRDNPYIRCVAVIIHDLHAEEAVRQSAFLSGTNVVYNHYPPEKDDLDYIDRVTAHEEMYDPETYRQHGGSIWAQREQNLQLFWRHLERCEVIVPYIFCRDTFTEREA